MQSCILLRRTLEYLLNSPSNDADMNHSIMEPASQPNQLNTCTFRSLELGWVKSLPANEARHRESGAESFSRQKN
jgi:hypothetical protein